jgi:phytoene dehydrogenase-like protein
MTDARRVVVVGAGHNGLVCAAYLAKAGRDVVVVEAGEAIGGAAITREFAPGFRVSAVAHLLEVLDAGIEGDLDLRSEGLRFIQRDLKTVALARDGRHLSLVGDLIIGEGVNEPDRNALAEYRGRMERFAELLTRIYDRRPARLAGGGGREIFAAAQLGLDIRRLGTADMREFMRIAGINIFDVLEETFEHPLLKGALSLDGVLGAHLGPRSNNSVLHVLHRLTGSRPGARSLPEGGMGAVTAAMADAARARGAAIRTGSPVSRILLDKGRAAGVELSGGEQIAAAAVVSSADPRTTFLELVGAPWLDAGFAHSVARIRMHGDAAKLHLALDGPPQFTGLDAALLGERLVIAPDLDYVERAFNHAKYGEYSPAPVFEIVLPSVHDATLAPKGQHVLSAVVQYAPYELREGWQSARDTFMNRAIDLLAEYAPGLRGQIVAAELLTPADIEKEFRMSGGHWHHGELALDQFLMLRPVPTASQYATPVPGLYLCGAGCHPGGGVMGRAGRNAATEILAAGASA